MNQYNRFFEQIRDKVNVSDIVRAKVSLAKKGQEYSGLCPFHTEKTPSFTVNDQKRFYHCFGCGAHGDSIKFVSETHGFSYMESAKKIAEENGIELPKQSAQQQRIFEVEEKILKALALASSFFQKHLTKNIKDYLYERSVSDEIISQYELGFSGSGKSLVKHLEENHISQRTMLDSGLVGKGDDGSLYPVFRKRIMFPIKNIYGKVIAFGGRIVGEGMPKYLNSPESLIFKKSETLYGEDIATGAAYQKKRIIVVEGYMDVIAMHRAGFKESVATLGTAVTQDHLSKLWRIADELIFCLDGDESGLRAMKKAISLVLPILGKNRRASFLVLQSKMDPDDVIKKYGNDYMNTLITDRLPTSDMIWYLETRNKNFHGAEDKAELETKLEEYLSNIEDNILKSHMKREFKNRIWNMSRDGGNRAKNKLTAKADSLPEVKEEVEIIEYNLCAIIVRYPEILDNEDVYDRFTAFSFKRAQLKEFQSLIIDLYSQNSALNTELVEANMQKSSFSNLFVLLSSRETSFLDVLSLDNNEADHNLLWELFVKKYELETLKSEFVSILSSEHEEKFVKASAYLDEINRSELFINKLQETLVS
jgi:DNA primase